MLGRTPDYIADLLTPAARSSLYKRHFAAISTCHGHVDVSTTEPSRLLRRRLGIGADRSQATAIKSVIQTKSKDSSVLSA